jgi:hypothetical protein
LRPAAAALVLAVFGCTPAAETAVRQAAEPAAVAAAVCRQIKTSAAGECEGISLANRGSEIAYASCLDYNRRDVRACDRLRHAYEDEIRRQLAGRLPPVAGTALAEKRDALAGLEPRNRYRTTEALYKAANSDADTFEAALLIPEVRKKIEAALGRPLSDARLRAMIDNNRTEAIYRYGYLRRPLP